jgi:transposase
MDDVNDDANGGYRRVEVLTGPGRRRHWSDEQKARIAAEAMVPGAVVSQIARRWQVCPQQVFAWRRAALRGSFTDLVTSGPAFVPIIEAPPVADQLATTSTASWVPEIEIDVGGTRIRVAAGVDTQTLTAVLRAVREASA